MKQWCSMRWPCNAIKKNKKNYSGQEDVGPCHLGDKLHSLQLLLGEY